MIKKYEGIIYIICEEGFQTALGKLRCECRMACVDVEGARPLGFVEAITLLLNSYSAERVGFGLSSRNRFRKLFSIKKETKIIIEILLPFVAMPIVVIRESRVKFTRTIPNLAMISKEKVRGV